MHDIKNIYNQELECLESAVKNGKNPYHTFTLATKIFSDAGKSILFSTGIIS